jgi:phosphate transport system substrate-binding protein
MHSIYFMLRKYIKGVGELIIMKSIIEDTRGVSPIVATLLLIVVVASASSFIAVMVSGFGRDTAEVDVKDVGEAAAIRIDVTGTDLAKLATDALGEEYGEINRGVKIRMDEEGRTTHRGIQAVGGRMADIAAADRELTLDELEDYPALEPYQIGNAVIVVISNGLPPQKFTNSSLRDIYKCENATWTGFHYEGETGIEERFWEYLNLTADNTTEINNKNKNVTSSFELMLETVKDADDPVVGFIPFGYVMDERNYIAGIGNVSAANITLEKITEAVREENETEAEEMYPSALRPPIYYVTNGKPSTMCDAFIKWVRSPEGQAILKEEGYVSLY